jgi:hypothetical protein
MNGPLSLATYASIDSEQERVFRVERAHRLRVYAAVGLAIALIMGLALYGLDYYLLSAAERPFSAKHQLLKPSGRIGIKLGMLGIGMFLAIFVYPLRKRIRWLSRQGSTKHWLDFHIVLGLSAPVVIAFHSSFKFQGLAGMAFWIMFSVALSGIVGRYLYAQVPRSLNSAQLSLKELEGLEETIKSELSEQSILNVAHLAPTLHMPSSEEVGAMPVYRALLLMMALDLARPFHIARLRLRVLGWARGMLSMGGLLRSPNQELERVVDAARRKSTLSKRIVFLQRTQQVFHLWHVIHRPFSYSFAVLAIVHVAVVVALGYI